MNRQKYRYGLLAAVLAVTLCGCHATTHISRDEQLSHVTTQAASSAATTTPATTIPTVETTVTTTVPQTAPASTETRPPETTSAPSTAPPTSKATEPRPTAPPQTTTPEATPATTAPATVPETTPVTEATSPQTEPAVTEPNPYDISGHSCGALEYAIRDAINAQRTAEGLEELTLSGRLSAVSSVRAYETSLVFSHTRPDGRDCFTVLGDYGVGYGRAAENLLQCSDGYSAADMVALWMSSSGHRANILDPEVSTVGIGVYRSGGMIYVATIFTG